MTGLPGGVLAVVAGAFVGGAISDWLPRRTSYIFCGVLLALGAAAMAVAPILPATFSVGALTIQFTGGMVGAASYALALELSGAEPMTAGTRMALFAAASSAGASYMTWLGGRGYHGWGVRGLLGMDACLGLVAAVLIVALFRVLREPVGVRGASIAVETAVPPPSLG